MGYLLDSGNHHGLWLRLPVARAGMGAGCLYRGHHGPPDGMASAKRHRWRAHAPDASQGCGRRCFWTQLRGLGPPANTRSWGYLSQVDSPFRAILILMPTHKLTAEILNAAILGFEEQKRRIDTQIVELRQMLTGTPTETAALSEAPKGKRRKMSAAARKRMGDAQRKRWAESKKESEPPSPVTPDAPKAKRKLSAAGKKAIADATKRRWARVRAEAAKAAKAQQTPAAKKAVKRVPVKASRKAAKKGAAKRPQKAATTPPAVPAATE